MANLIYWRMAGYIFAICLHVTNILVMRTTSMPPFKSKELENIASLRWQFFTMWNIIFQTFYSLFGLTCDVLTVFNLYETSALRSVRVKIFSYIMWTSGFMVATIFWPIFLYDRSLVYPEFIDEIIPPRSNYVMHAWIIVVLLWEFLYLPRYEKISHKTGTMTGSIIFFCYLTWIFYSHSVNGLWPYPFFEMTYGTIYFPVVVLGLYLVMIVSYFHQWPLVHLVWGKSANKVD